MAVDPLLPRSPEYLGEASYNLRIAPLRRAFLVRTGDNDQLLRAVQAASALWGGARCPILPVEEDGSIQPGWIQIAEVMQVSAFVDFTSEESGEGSAWTNDEQRAQWPASPARPLSDGRFWSAHPVVASFRPGEPKEIWLPDADDLLGSVTAGSYGLDEELPLFRSAGFSIASTNSDIALAKAQVWERSALGATLHGEFDTDLHGGLFSSLGLLWVVDDRDSFDDLVRFWNSRAIRPRYQTPRAPSVCTTAAAATGPDFRAEFTDAVAASSRTTPSFIVASLSVSPERLREIAEGFGATEHLDSRFTESLGRSPKADRELSYVVNTDPDEYWLPERKFGAMTGATVRLVRPTVHVGLDSPVAWTPEYVMSGRVTASVTSPAIAGPRIQAVAELYYPNARWNSNSIAITTNNVPTYNFNLAVPTPAEILATALAAKGYRYEISDKGQQIQGVVTMGAVADLFRDRGVTSVIRSLSRQPARDMRQAISRLLETGNVSEETVNRLRTDLLLGHRSSRTMRGLRSIASDHKIDSETIPAAVSALLSSGALEMGLVASCELCSLSAFQPLERVQGAGECSGCGSPAELVSDQQGAPEIHYALNALMQTVSLNGGLAPLAAVAVLESEGYYIVPGADLFTTADDTIAGEVDLIGWCGSSLVAGEAKMSLAQFDSTDWPRELDRAAAIGASEFAAVCLETVPADNAAPLESFASELGIGVRIMDADALLTTPE